MQIMPNRKVSAMKSGKRFNQYVFALAHGAGNDLFYYGDWIREPGVAICCCNDGLRPVMFKLEATDEVSKGLPAQQKILMDFSV